MFVEVAACSPFRPDGATVLGGHGGAGAQVGEIDLTALEVTHEITELPRPVSDGHDVFAWSDDGSRDAHWRLW